MVSKVCFVNKLDLVSDVKSKINLTTDKYINDEVNFTKPILEAMKEASKNRKDKTVYDVCKLDN